MDVPASAPAFYPNCATRQSIIVCSINTHSVHIVKIGRVRVSQYFKLKLFSYAANF